MSVHLACFFVSVDSFSIFPLSVSFDFVICHMQVHLSGKLHPRSVATSEPTSLLSTVATFLTTRLMAVLQPSGYPVFHGGDTPIQLSLP